MYGQPKAKFFKPYVKNNPLKKPYGSTADKAGDAGIGVVIILGIGAFAFMRYLDKQIKK
jgi:hypothetical protein